MISGSCALIATATDYDSWRENSEAVTAAEVFKTLQTNADTSRLVAARILDEFHNAITGVSSDNGIGLLLEEKGSMKFSIMPRSEKQKPEDRQKLAYILPEYFAGPATHKMPAASKEPSTGDAAIVQEYPFADYLQTPERFRRSVEATVLHAVLRDAFSVKDIVNEKYLKEYLEEHQEFRQLFLDSWKEGSFEHVRRHDDLKLTVQCTASNVVITQPQFTEVHGDYYDITTGEDDQSIINWLSQIDYILMQRDVYARRAEGTGDWFLNSSEYSRWKSGAGAPILWCPGIPGSGKTIISSVAIHDLQLDEDRPIFFVYFDYKRQKDQSISMVLRCIARQIYERLPKKRHVFRDVYQKSRSAHPTQSLLTSLLKRTLQLFNQSIYVVFDALDEYLQSYNDGDIEALLAEILGLDSNIRLMVTSRILGGMEVIFTNHGAARLEVSGKEDDIAKYIGYRVMKKVPFAKGICPKIVDAVLSASNSFLAVCLIMDRLCSFLNRGRILEELAKLPETLEDSYKIILERIDDQESERRELAQKVIAWMALSFRPLKIEDLQHALATSPGRLEVEDYIVGGDVLTGLCAGIVIIDQESGIVRFVHQTAHDYVKGSGYLNLGHPYLGKTCMALIKNTLRKEDYISVRFSSYPFLDYALSWWGFHLVDDEESELEEIIESLSDEKVVHMLSEKMLPEPELEMPDLDDPDDNSNPPEQGSVIHVAAFFVLRRALAYFLAKGHSPNERSHIAKLTPLALAASRGHTMMALLLLGADGVDVNLSDAEGASPLALAAGVGDEEMLEILLESTDVRIDSRDSYGRTPLMVASGRGLLDVAQKLIEWGAAIDFIDDCGDTALTLAIEHRKTEVTEMLLDAGANPLIVQSMINVARCSLTGKEALHLVLQRAPIVARSKDSDNRTVLSHAVVENPVVAETLLEFLPDIADVQMVDLDNRSPLSYALHEGRHAIAQRILQRIGQEGTYKRVLDKFGRSDLCYAVQSRSIPAVITLLQQDNDAINMKYEKGFTLLIYASKGCIRDPGKKGGPGLLICEKFGTGVEVAKLLLERGADVHAADESGRTALSHACGILDKSLVELLLKSGANPQEADREGRTPLSYIHVNGFFIVPGSDSKAVDTAASIVKILLEHGANPDIKDQQGRCILSRFVVWGKAELLELLSAGETRMNAPDNLGRTPLWYAVQGNWRSRWCLGTNQREVVEWLLNRGADPTVRDIDGKCPKALAEANDYTCLVELFEAHTGRDVEAKASIKAISM